MIDENGYSDHIDNKASHCAKMLNDYYRKFDAQKGTQFVFSDLGTYKPGNDVYSERTIYSLKQMVSLDSIPKHSA